MAVVDVRTLVFCDALVTAGLAACLLICRASQKIRGRSEADFSHGICLECMKELSPPPGKPAAKGWGMTAGGCI